MVAYKVILTIAVVSMVAFVQINARPAENEWTAPFEAALKNFTSKMSEFVGDQSELTNTAKNSLNNFHNNIKSELDTLSKSFESKTGLSDLFKESAKQWQSSIDTYTKNIPEDLTPQKLNVKFDQTMKFINDQATELSKKAGTNTEVEKEIKDFSVKQIKALTEQIQSIQSKFVEKKN